jgi:DNA-binding transcriptional ArsR family regulator
MSPKLGERAFHQALGPIRLALVTESDDLRGLVSLLYEQDFPGAHGAWVEAFLALMIELRCVFGNDLDKVIILSTIGQRMLLNAGMPVLSDAAVLDVPELHLVGTATTIEGLARTTGIPRESVRRKIEELRKAGMVTRDPERGLVVCPEAAQHLAKATRIEIETLDRLLADYLGRLTSASILEVKRKAV